jgi:hypothetical protein
MFRSEEEQLRIIMEQSLKEAEETKRVEVASEPSKKRKEKEEVVETKPTEVVVETKKQKREEKVDPNRPPPDCVLRVKLNK